MTSRRRVGFVGFDLPALPAGLALFLSLSLFVSSTAQAATSEEQQRAEMNALYQSARSALESRDHARALTLLEQYLDLTRTRAHRPERIFWAIDQAGYLHLGVERDPAQAIAFFTRMRDDPRLTDLDRGAIRDWIEVAESWKQERAHASTPIDDAAALYQRGKRFFESGQKKAETGIMAFAHADYHVADGYLRRFALLHDKSPRIGEVLYMLGAMRAWSRPDEAQWTDNFYLKEVIRRFPHTELAEEAHALLRLEATRAFPPKGIPDELSESLGVYEGLARRTAPAA